ncbi:MAG: hypothetical protein OSA23_17555, partial [Rhodospirillales bacterium]|nr:hypothetical protein [Rhodospirillales bacterium]
MKKIILCLGLMTGLLILSVFPVFASDLPKCKRSEKLHDCFGTKSYKKSKYVGEWQNGKWNGQGTYTYSNGAEYEGDFKDNQK